VRACSRSDHSSSGFFTVSACAPYGPRTRLPSRIQDAKTTQSGVKRSNREHQTWAYSSARRPRGDVFEVNFFGSRHPPARPDTRGPHAQLCDIMREPPHPSAGWRTPSPVQPYGIDGKTTNGSNPKQCLSCPVCPSLPAPGRRLGGSEKWAVACARAEHAHDRLKLEKKLQQLPV
jgi:hypothetical protein